MANAVYPLFKAAILDGLANTDLNDGTVKVALIDTGTYTYSAAHEFYDDLSGVVGTPQTITNTTVAGGLLDGDDVTFTALSGNSVEALVIYIDTGDPATSRLYAYLDTDVTGLPITPDGTDVTIAWHASGIVQL